jgi:hypothetical protein
MNSGKLDVDIGICEEIMSCLLAAQADVDPLDQWLSKCPHQALCRTICKRKHRTGHRVVAAILLTRSIPVPFVSMRRFNGLGMRRLKVFYVTKGK